MEENSKKGLPMAGLKNIDQMVKIIRIILAFSPVCAEDISTLIETQSRLNIKTIKNNIASINAVYRFAYSQTAADEDLISAQIKERGKKYYYIKSGMFEKTKKYINDIYNNINFSDQNFYIDLFILQMLNTPNVSHSNLFEECCNKTGVCGAARSEYLTELPFNRHLSFLQDLGYISKTDDEFSLNTSVTDLFINSATPDKSCAGLLAAVDFFSLAGSSSVLGSNLLKKMSAKINYDLGYTYESLFSVKDKNIFAALNDNVLIQLEQCIVNGDLAEISKGSKSKIVCYPIKIVNDKAYGRQYLFYLSQDETTLTTRNVSRIDTVKVLKSGARTTTAAGAHKQVQEYLSTSFISVSEKNRSNPAEFIIYIKKKYKKEVLKDLGQYTALTQVEFQGKKCFQLTMNNSNYILPWLRLHYNKVNILYCSNPNFETRVSNDLKEWRELYGL